MSTINNSKKVKPHIFRKSTSRISCCPNCKTKLMNKKYRPIYKDVYECTECGDIWIMPDELIELDQRSL